MGPVPGAPSGAVAKTIVRDGLSANLPFAERAVPVAEAGRRSRREGLAAVHVRMAERRMVLTSRPEGLTFISRG
jgi:hypothetical protein